MALRFARLADSCNKLPIMPSRKSDEPILAFTRAADWHAWLAAHHDKIDSQKRALDDSAWLQRFSPRTAKSPWSKINCQKAESLIAAGLMQPPGLAEVARAKRDGRWERAYDGARAATVPPDLAAALTRNARAHAFFEKLDGANRYAILYRVQTAKKPETRAARITRFVAMCARGETIHPKAKKKASAK